MIINSHYNIHRQVWEDYWVTWCIFYHYKKTLAYWLVQYSFVFLEQFLLCSLPWLWTQVPPASVQYFDCTTTPDFLSFYFIVFETDFNCVALASLELSYKTVLGWNSWLPFCCYFPGADAGITGVNHRVCLLIFKFYLSLIIIACICCLCVRENVVPRKRR